MDFYYNGIGEKEEEREEEEGVRNDAKSLPLRAVLKGNPNDEIIIQYLGTSLPNDYQDHTGKFSFVICI